MMSTSRSPQPTRRAQSYIQPATRHLAPGPSGPANRRLLQAVLWQEGRSGQLVLDFDPVARSAANLEHIRPLPTAAAERCFRLEQEPAGSSMHPEIFSPVHWLA